MMKISTACPDQQIEGKGAGYYFFSVHQQDFLLTISQACAKTVMEIKLYKYGKNLSVKLTSSCGYCLKQ